MAFRPKGDEIGVMKIHVEDVDMWVDLPVFRDSSLDTSEIDLEDLEIEDYRQALVDSWPISPNFIKRKLGKSGVKEIYDHIIQQHPSLHPVRITKFEPVIPTMPDDDKYEIMKWFRSRGGEGLRPAVLHGNPPVVVETPDGAA